MAPPILGHLLACLLAIPGIPDADPPRRDGDVLQRIADRPNHLPTFATIPVGDDAPWWFRRGEDRRIGLLGEVRTMDPLDESAPAVTTIGLVSETDRFDAPSNRFTVGATFVDADPFSAQEPSRTGLFTAWGWRPNAGTTIQPGLGWSIDADGGTTQTAVSLGIRIEF